MQMNRLAQLNPFQFEVRGRLDDGLLESGLQRDELRLPQDARPPMCLIERRASKVHSQTSHFCDFLTSA
jgi:hypothetical protein